MYILILNLEKKK